MKVHCTAPFAPTAGFVTEQPVMPAGNLEGQSAAKKFVNAGVKSFTTSEDSGFAPMLAAVSLYCSLSPGMAGTLVRGTEPWVRLLNRFTSKRLAAETKR